MKRRHRSMRKLAEDETEGRIRDRYMYNSEQVYTDICLANNWRVQDV